MLFLTRQPQIVSEVLNNSDYYAPYESKLTNGTGTPNTPIKNQFGYMPIFITPMIDKVDFIIKYMTSSPSCPEVNIIFDTDDYDTISSSKWFHYLKNKNANCDLEAVDNLEKEYFTKLIKKNNVKIKFNTITMYNMPVKMSTYGMILLPEFWDVMNIYFPNDKRDITKLLMSNEYHIIMEKFNKNMDMKINNFNSITHDQILQTYRNDIMNVALQIYK